MNELPLDGEYYTRGGEVVRFEVRPCGRRHSFRLVCKPCTEAREAAERHRRVNPIIPDLREWVIQRDGSCVKCGARTDLTVDHDTPVIRGGKTNPDNLKTLCRSCNSRKGMR